MNKQIEEMARIIDDNHGFIISSVETATALYNAGYRKVSQEGAECPTCHGTGRIGTTDWLTKGISEEQLEREKQEALDEFARENGYCKASEVFEAIEKLFRQRFSDEVDGECRINAQEFAELKKKYESEGADDV